MKRYARVKEGRIAAVLETGDDEVILPFVEQDDELGGDQVLGPQEISIEADRVVGRRRAVRALSGVVAILSEDGAVQETRDLGGQLIPVADNVVRFVESKPVIDETTHVYEDVEFVRKDDVVEKVWKTRPLTRKEVDDRAGKNKRKVVMSRFGERGLQVAFDQENRLRKLEGKEELSLEEFISQEMSKV